MDTRKTLLLGIKRGVFLALIIGFALWPELTRGRTSRMPVSAQAGRGFRRATLEPRWSGDLNAVAVNAAGDVFVAAGGACGAEAGSGAGVFRSSDAGESWTEQNEGLTDTSVRALATGPSGAVFAGTHDGVFRSTDYANTWSPTSLRGVDISTIVSGHGVLFAGDGCLCSGVYRSRDGGDSWEQVNSGLSTCVKSLAIDAGTVFVATAADGVYRSADDGDSWSPANAGLTAFALKTVAVSDEGDVFLGSASDGVFRSTDHGMTWSRAGLAGVGVNTLAIDAGGEIFAGTDTAVYRSINDGDNWEAVELGLTERAEVSALAFDPSGIAFAAAGRNILRTVSARITGDSGARPNATLVAAPTVDSTASSSGAAVASLTWSHTVGAGSNQVLIVGTSNLLATDTSKTITGVTYGGTPLTRAGFQANGTILRAEIWYLLAPPQGTTSVVVTLPSGTDIVAGSVSVNGVDPTTPLGPFASASGNSTAPAVNVSAINGSSLVIDTLAALGNAGAATAGAGQTQRWNLTTGSTNSDVRGTGSTEPATSTSVTMSWTLAAKQPWAVGAISLNGVGACCAACVLGYPITEVGFPRSSTIFLENVILRGVQGPAQCAPGTVAAVVAFYNDEHAITLGVRQVNVTSISGTTTSPYPVSVLPANPPGRASTDNPLPAGAVPMATGTNITSGDQSGVDTNACGDPKGCGRPMWPVLYVTDITDDPTSRAGDWQHYGGSNPSGNNPSDIFGTWKAAVKTVDNTKSPPAVSVIPDADPAKNNWALGPGADPVPPGLLNEGYGAEVRWNLNTLVDNNNLALVANRKYRLQVIVHDGDQNKTGGDVGEGCSVAVFDQTCFTSPTPTPTSSTPTDTPTVTPTVTPTPTGGADLVSVKTSSPTSICINNKSGVVNVSCASDCSGTRLSSLLYTISVTNNGPNTAQSVVLTDTLPNFTNFLSCRIAPDTVCPNPGVAVGANGTVSVSLGDMALNTNQIVRIAVAVDGNGILANNDANPPGLTQISNTGTASSSTSDPNSANSSSTATTSVLYCNPPGLRSRPNRE